MKLSEETKAKIRAAWARQVITKEHAAAISFARRGGIPARAASRRVRPSDARYLEKAAANIVLYGAR